MLTERRPTSLPRRKRAGSQHRRRRAIAAAVAILAALLTWVLIEVAVGVDLHAPAFEGSGPGFDIGVVEVLVTSSMAALAAWSLLGLLERWTRRPGRVWSWIAIGAFLVSLSGPMSGTGIPAIHRWLLVLLHVVVAAVLIPLLSRTTEA